MLEVTGLSAGYGTITLLHDVSLHVGTAECVALLGSNGAGKTTLLNTLSGLIRPDAGSIRFAGAEVAGEKPHRLVAKGLVQVPEGRRVFPGLLVRENLPIGAYARRRGAEEELERIFRLFPILKARLGQRGGTLSGGEQQMLAVARALMAGPRLLMLDEPSLGLAPMVVEQLFAALQEIKAQTTILVVEQNVHVALDLVDRAYVLREGRIVREGDCADLKQEAWMREAYLGL